jgi:hypothetical protein
MQDDIYMPRDSNQPSRQQQQPTTQRSKNSTDTKDIKDEKNELLEFLPNHCKSLSEFYKLVKTKIGILFLYKSQDMSVIHKSLDKLFMDSELMNILETQFVTFALDGTNSKDAKNIVQQNSLITPCVLFLYNPFNLEITEGNNFKNLIVDRVEGSANLDDLPLAIFKNLSNKENIQQHTSPKRNNTSQRIPSNKSYDTDMYIDDDHSHGSIIQKQQEELKRLEQQEEEDRKKKIRLEAEKRQKEEEERIKEEKIKEEFRRKENEKIIKKKALPEQPKEGDPNSTFIVFRLPSGERSERRFNKGDTIEDLYNYIESLENIEHNNKLELIQTFPFIAYTNKEKTLEEEKLFPNAVLQVKELD